MISGRCFVYASSRRFTETRRICRCVSRPAAADFTLWVTTAAEHFCWLYWKNYGLSTAPLRYFNVYGPRQRPDMAMHRFLKERAHWLEITLYDDGSKRATSRTSPMWSWRTSRLPSEPKAERCSTSA